MEPLILQSSEANDWYRLYVFISACSDCVLTWLHTQLNFVLHLTDKYNIGFMMCTTAILSNISFNPTITHHLM